MLREILLFLLLLPITIVTSSLILKSRFKKYIIEFLLPVSAFTFFAGIFSIFSLIVPGEPLISLNSKIAVTREGINAFLLFFLRTATALSVTGLYAIDSYEGEFPEALKWLRFPDEIIFIFSMAIKHIKIFIKDLKEFVIAKRLRVIRKNSLLEELKLIASRSGLLFKKAERSAYEINMGFRIRIAAEKIRYPETEKTGFRGFIFLFLFISLSVILVLFDRIIL